MNYDVVIIGVGVVGSAVALGLAQQGDINIDETIDVIDVVLLLNFILELQTPSDDQIWLSDINQDEFLNILDIVALVSIILD